MKPVLEEKNPFLRSFVTLLVEQAETIIEIYIKFWYYIIYGMQNHN